MDAFGTDYIAHNTPLLFVSGLRPSDDSHVTGGGHHSQEGGFRVKTDLPLIDTELATVVRDALSSHDGSTASWGSTSAQARLFTIRNVGRVSEVCRESSTASVSQPSSPIRFLLEKHLPLHTPQGYPPSIAMAVLHHHWSYTLLYRLSRPALNSTPTAS